MTYSVCLGDWYIVLGAQTLAPKQTFQVFFFQLYFIQKYVEVAISDFTVHPIILKWLKNTQNEDKREKQRDKRIEAKEEAVYKCFYSLDYVICSFFYINILQWLCFLLYYLLIFLSSDLFAALKRL